MLRIFPLSLSLSLSLERDKSPLSIVNHCHDPLISRKVRRNKRWDDDRVFKLTVPGKTVLPLRPDLPPSPHPPADESHDPIIPGRNFSSNLDRFWVRDGLKAETSNEIGQWENVWISTNDTGEEGKHQL
jgi:hypothetical protein